MRRNAPHSQPSLVSADSGEILLDGPGGLAAAFTPEAAEETARRMLSAVAEARAQKSEASENG